MARISNREWAEFQEVLRANALAHKNGKTAPFTEDDIKEKAYDAMFEATSAWCYSFGINLRDAIYCEWWTTANTMLKGKRGEAKDRIIFIIRTLKNLAKGR